MYVQLVIRTGGRQLVCGWGLGSAWSRVCVHYNLFRGGYSYSREIMLSVGARTTFPSHSWTEEQSQVLMWFATLLLHMFLNNCVEIN